MYIKKTSLKEGHENTRKVIVSRLNCHCKSMNEQNKFLFFRNRSWIILLWLHVSTNSWWLFCNENWWHKNIWRGSADSSHSNIVYTHCSKIKCVGLSCFKSWRRSCTCKLDLQSSTSVEIIIIVNHQSLPSHHNHYVLIN